MLKCVSTCSGAIGKNRFYLSDGRRLIILSNSDMAVECELHIPTFCEPHNCQLMTLDIASSTDCDEIFILHLKLPPFSWRQDASDIFLSVWNTREMTCQQWIQVRVPFLASSLHCTSRQSISIFGSTITDPKLLSKQLMSYVVLTNGLQASEDQCVVPQVNLRHENSFTFIDRMLSVQCRVSPTGDASIEYRFDCDVSAVINSVYGAELVVLDSLEAIDCEQSLSLRYHSKDDFPCLVAGFRIDKRCCTLTSDEGIKQVCWDDFK
jgi:hypothetical protein